MPYRFITCGKIYVIQLWPEVNVDESVSLYILSIECVVSWLQHIYTIDKSYVDYDDDGE